MATHDLLNYLQEIRGTNEIGQDALATEENGIYHDIVAKTTEDDGITVRFGDGMYGSMQYMYGVFGPILANMDGVVNVSYDLEGKDSNGIAYTPISGSRILKLGEDLLDPAGSIETIIPMYPKIEIVADNIDEVVVVADNIDNVNSTSTNIGNVNVVGNDLKNEWEHIDDYGSIVDPSSGGIGESKVTTVAENIDNVILVANDIVNVGLVGTDIVNVNSVATTVVPNIAEILLADDNAAIATTKASEASASAAAALVSEGLTEADKVQTGLDRTATNADVVTTNADVVTTNADAATATTKASESLTSANASEASRLAAEGARDQALDALDNFDDRYLGEKAVPPTLDNDGDPLATGAIYYDVSSIDPIDYSFKVWNGTSWGASSVSPEGLMVKTANLSDVDNVIASRQNLGVEIGVDVAAYDATLEIGATSDQTDIELSALMRDYSEPLSNKTLTDISNTIHSDVTHFVVQATEAIVKGNVLVATGIAEDLIAKAGKRSALTQTIIGIAGEAIANGIQGGVISTGTISDVPNPGGALDVGDILYGDDTGSLTTVAIVNGTNYNQPIAHVIKANSSVVTIMVNVHSGHETANLVGYDNTTSGLVAEDVGSALDELSLIETNVTTNLGYNTALNNGIVTSSDGTDATIPGATITEAGLLSATDKVLLNEAVINDYGSIA